MLLITADFDVTLFFPTYLMCDKMHFFTASTSSDVVMEVGKALEVSIGKGQTWH